MGGAGKYFAVWQPLRTEDARTALTFGFLRHAPASLALRPWLREVLGRDVRAGPLEVSDFWPSYRSHMGGTRTEPDLVFEAADDNGQIVVIVEAKPGAGMHTSEQLEREAVDTAFEHSPRPRRIALIAVGADLGTAASRDAWQNAVDTAVLCHGPPNVRVEVFYSSWATLGNHIRRAREDPTFRLYADDALTQLRSHALMGYEGAPMLPDREDVSVVEGFELANRAVAQAHQLLNLVHGQSRFQRLGLGAHLARVDGRPTQRFAMRRDGTSTSLQESPIWFQTTMFMSAYGHASWDEDRGLFVAVTVTGAVEPELHVGAFYSPWRFPLLDEYRDSTPADQLTHTALAAHDGGLTEKSATRNSQWLYAPRVWQRDQGNGDVAWVVDRLAEAASVFGLTLDAP